MSYRDFDLRTAREKFKLALIEGADLFAATPAVEPGGWLRAFLAEWTPTALALNTEKARSELLITPILLDVVLQSGRRVNLFSGIALDIDRDRGLNGVCDYLLSRSPVQLYLDRPVVAVVEAKREDITGGLGQCLAEMVGAQAFNARDERVGDRAVHGAVTAGNVWKFLKLEGNTATIDGPEYYLPQVGKILGILLEISLRR